MLSWCNEKNALVVERSTKVIDITHSSLHFYQLTRYCYAYCEWHHHCYNGVVVRDIASGAGGSGFDSRAGQIRHSCQRLATVATFLRNVLPRR